jgi:peptide/nickel transport system permease protein
VNARATLFYVARRLVALVVVLVIVSFTVFSLLYLAPGSPEQLLLGTRPATPETIKSIREQYHLDDPFLEQYGRWAEHAARLDFGVSIRTNEPVLSAIRQRLSITLELGAMAFLFTMLAGIPLGVLAAVRRQTNADRGIVALSVIGISAPAFASGILLLYVFAVELGWFPVFGPGSGFVDRIHHLALPAIALALTAMGLVVKLTRAAMMESLDQDFITFARARGLSRTRVLTTYALRNSLVPIITAGGLLLGYMLAGAVLVEVTFALPGVGSLLVDSITAKDIPTVQGVVVLIAIVVVAANLLADLVYVAVDPRIGFERSQI